MGILTHTDILNSKFVEAHIIYNDQLHVVNIKHTHGHVFIVRLKEQLMAFSLKHAERLMYKPGTKKQTIIIWFDADNCVSLQPFEIMLRDMKFPQLNNVVYGLLEAFANVEDETTDFRARDFTEIEKQFQNAVDSGKLDDNTEKYYNDILALLNHIEPDCFPYSAREFLKNFEQKFSVSDLGIQAACDSTLSTNESKTKFKHPLKKINKPINAGVSYLKLFGVIFVVLLVGYNVIEYDMLGDLFPKEKSQSTASTSAASVILCDSESVKSRYSGPDGALRASMAYISGTENCPYHIDIVEAMLDENIMTPRMLEDELFKTGSMPNDDVRPSVEHFYTSLKAFKGEQP